MDPSAHPLRQHGAGKLTNQRSVSVILGEDLLGWLLLALGAAMAVGNGMALVRPPQALDDGDLDRPPMWRSVLYIVLGSLAALWALFTLVG